MVINLQKENKKYFPRFLMRDLTQWLERKEIYAIKGPRQSGKTTILEMLKDFLIKEKKVNPKNIIFLTFEDREVLEKFSQDPKTFIKSYLLTSEKYYFLMDEFQYVSAGGQKLKLLYDLFQNIKFIITGSSSLELTDQTGKFLVGRIFSFYLFPLSFAEFLQIKDERLFRLYQEKHQLIQGFFLTGKDFLIKKDIFLNDLNKYFEEYIIWGGYPEVIKTEDQETKRMILKNIYDTYITKDIVGLLKITDTFKFRTLLGLLSHQIGNLINYNSLATHSQSYFQEVKKQLAILEETYLINLLRPFYTNKATELRKNPKIYFIDSGLRNYIINDFNILENRIDKGSLIENAALEQLKINLGENWQINFWRTLAKAEVDFILKNNEIIMPVEIKYTNFAETKIPRSFKSFINQYAPKQGIIATKNFWGAAKLKKSLIKFIPAVYF